MIAQLMGEDTCGIQDPLCVSSHYRNFLQSGGRKKEAIT